MGMVLYNPMLSPLSIVSHCSLSLVNLLPSSTTFLDAQSTTFTFLPLTNPSIHHTVPLSTSCFVSRTSTLNRESIYYDDITLSFSNYSSLVSVANYTVPRFYQGHEKIAKKWGQTHPLDNQTVFRAVLPNGSAVFRLDLKTKLKYKFMFWKTRRYRFEASVNLEVKEDGATKVKNKEEGIKMKKSDSSSTRFNSFHLCVLMNLLVLLAIL